MPEPRTTIAPVRFRHGALLAVTVTVSLLALTGCSAIAELGSIFSAPVARDAETQEVSAAGAADVFTMRVGDCYNEQVGDPTEITSVPAVPCSEPHDNEAYHAFDLPDGDFPGDDAINTAADDGCYEAFDDFVNFAWEDSELDYGFITPTAGSWSDGDLEILCAIYSVDLSRVTGTLANAQR